MGVKIVPPNLFYFFLKYLVKTEITDHQLYDILLIYSTNITNDFIDIKTIITQHIFTKIKNKSLKQQFLLELLDEVGNNLELTLFII